MRIVVLALILVLTTAVAGRAQSKFSVDTGECQSTSTVQRTVLKTPIRSSLQGAIRMYGRLQFTDFKSNSSETHCHVVYELYLAQRAMPFQRVHRLEWDTEAGEIAGIDLIGFSPDKTKAAANYWLAEGDGEEIMIAVYDASTRTTAFSSLGDKLSTRTKHDCETYYESADSVTNAGAVLVSVPPVKGCADSDGGLWLFEPATGSLTRLRRSSGRKPIDQ